MVHRTRITACLRLVTADLSMPRRDHLKPRLTSVAAIRKVMFVLASGSLPKHQIVIAGSVGWVAKKRLVCCRLSLLGQNSSF